MAFGIRYAHAESDGVAHVHYLLADGTDELNDTDEGPEAELMGFPTQDAAVNSPQAAQLAAAGRAPQVYEITRQARPGDRSREDRAVDAGPQFEHTDDRQPE